MAGGLQGAMLIMAGGLNKIVARFGDVLGTNLYGYYGSFVVCVIAIAVVYALILPALLLVPKLLIDRRRPNARNRLNQPITLNAAAAGGKGGCGPGGTGGFGDGGNGGPGFGSLLRGIASGFRHSSGSLERAVLI